MMKVGMGEKGVNKDTIQRLLSKSGLKITTLNSSREWGQGSAGIQGAGSEGCLFSVTGLLAWSLDVLSVFHSLLISLNVAD